MWRRLTTFTGWLRDFQPVILQKQPVSRQKNRRLREAIAGWFQAALKRRNG